jgi:hypothetical protein
MTLTTYHSEAEVARRMKLSSETGLCQCDTCVTNRQPPTSIQNGKPLPTLERIVELEEVEKIAQENFKKIKVVDGQAECQECKRLVKLIPNGSSVELDLHEKRRRALDNPNLSERKRLYLKFEFDKFEEKLARRRSIRTNIPLYRYNYGPIWLCGLCFDKESQKQKK